MSQITSGIRSIFSSPRVYDGFQNLMGASRMRQELVNDFIRPTPGMRLLDIGCGTAEILGFLPEDVHYWGYDISPRYIDAAQLRFGTRGHFHCGPLDAQQLDQLPQFDLVIATGVLHHLDDGEASGLFELAKHALTRDGRVVTIDPCLAPGQNPIARFLIANDRGQNVRDAAAYRELPRSNFTNIDGQLRHRRWIPYTHLVMECKQ